MSALPERSHVKANAELVDAFDRYLESCDNSQQTPPKYSRCCSAPRGNDQIRPTLLIDTDRGAIRLLLGKWQQAGLNPNSIAMLTCGLRSFFKFVNLAGLARHNPMLLIERRRIPTRVPVVLTIEQVEKLINAGEDPFERAVPEVLYATGVRVSELVNLRLEDIDWYLRCDARSQGQGRQRSRNSIRKLCRKSHSRISRWRCRSQHGYLFEAPARIGQIRRHATG